MSKRFIDTGIFDDDWFMDQSKDGKIFWLYLITKCDHAGIIKINEKLCKVQTGINDIQTLIKGLGNRLIRVSEHLYFIPKFIEFQYPGFPNSKVRQQQSAVEILKKHNLFDPEKLTLNKELSNSYDTDNGIDIGIEKGGKGGKFKVPTVEEIKAYCTERKNTIDPQAFYDHYEVRGWKAKGYTTQIKDWKAAVRVWEKNSNNFDNKKTPTATTVIYDRPIPEDLKRIMNESR